MNPSAWLAEKLFDFLNSGSPPSQADAIFVMAGKHERKTYGIDLWRKGFAPELILSVGRFEWRRFYSLDLPDGGLKQLVDSTKPQLRHFFIRFDSTEASASLIEKGRWGTLTEGRALAQYLPESVTSLSVISTSTHLRRTALVLHRLLRRRGLRLTFVAVSEELSSLRRDDLRRVVKSRVEVFQEFLKYIGYRIFFSIGVPNAGQKED